MKQQTWRSTGKAVFLLNDHFIWSTKYHKQALSPAGIKQARRGRLAYILFREFPDLRKQR
jgi:hypothetical protein